MNYQTLIIGILVFVANAIQPALIATGAQPNLDWKQVMFSTLFLAAVWFTKHVKVPGS